MQQGGERFKKGENEPAVESFMLATKILPDRSEGWVNLGSTLLRSRLLEKAIEALEKALSLDANQMTTHLLLGDAKRRGRQFSESVAHYRQAVSLQRTPASLNRLASALWADSHQLEAENLYRETVSSSPQFSLARINLANLLIEQGKVEDAEQQIQSLPRQPLSVKESTWLDNAENSIIQYRHLSAELKNAFNPQALPALREKLLQLPKECLRVDNAVLDELYHYAESANSIEETGLSKQPNLPSNWPIVEAAFQAGSVENIEEFLALDTARTLGPQDPGQPNRLLALSATIETASTVRNSFLHPEEAELQLRHWHATAFKFQPGMLPGHFKYTPNRISHNTSQTLVSASKTIGTFRYFVQNVYPKTKPGLARAITVWMALSKIHPFADGNGRMGRIWLNRELLWAKQMPAIFCEGEGLRRELMSTMSRFFNSGREDIASLVPVFISAQQYAKHCCEQVLKHDG